MSLSKQHSDMSLTFLAQVSIIPSLYVHWQGAGDLWLATRIGTDPLKFVTKEAEKDLQKGFFLGNTQSTYTQTVPKVFSE